MEGTSDTRNANWDTNLYLSYLQICVQTCVFIYHCSISTEKHFHVSLSFAVTLNTSRKLSLVAVMSGLILENGIIYLFQRIGWNV